MNWYLKVFRQFGDFSTRARRQEYWMFVLFNMIFAIVAMVVDNILGTTMDPLPYGVVYALYALAALIPGLAVAVRRLHDTGRSGWWILIAVIPLVGAIILLVFLCQDSQAGSNEYGPNPKDVGGNATGALDSNI